MSERSEPKRVQRKRTRGWKMPSNAVYVGRPTRWGNPYRKNDDGVITGPNGVVVFEHDGETYLPIAGPNEITAEDRKTMCEAFRKWIWKPCNTGFRERVKRELRGKDLACWCPLDQPCHADVLLELANGGASE